LIAEFAPHVALVEVRAGARGEAGLELASRLRAARKTAALPLILLFDDEDTNLRAAALRIGVDDYFALFTPPAEVVARLDALFWRTEAGRRTATLAALERRAEIDDFLQLLEAVRADIEAGLTGTLALIAAAAAPPARAPDEANAEAITTTPSPETRAFAAAHDFFKLNLRRVDSVAFYGPTLLLAYLPQKTRDAAHTDLARLGEEFQAMPERVSGSLDIGLASFPADGTEIESLIERAEAALQPTRPPRTEEEDAKETSANARPAAKPANADEPARHASRKSEPSAATETAVAERHGRATELSPLRAVRESKQTDMETSMMPAGGAGGGGVGQGTLAQSAADAAARERERRTRGAIMPRRLLLTVSDPARMAQINLLLRSAGYEVRAAFDGLQAINLLRIERPDLLVIDVALYGIDGLEALRRLRRQHQGRLPLPIVLLLPAATAAEREHVREEARELGVVSFVAIPYDPEELLMCVRTVGSTD
jgi:DNA-binding response OmpR family regulator